MTDEIAAEVLATVRGELEDLVERAVEKVLTSEGFEKRAKAAAREVLGDLGLPVTDVADANAARELFAHLRKWKMGLDKGATAIGMAVIAAAVSSAWGIGTWLINTHLFPRP